MDIPDLQGSNSTIKDDFEIVFNRLVKQKEVAKNIYNQYSKLLPISKIHIKPKGANHELYTYDNNLFNKTR